MDDLRHQSMQSLLHSPSSPQSGIDPILTLSPGHTKFSESQGQLEEYLLPFQPQVPAEQHDLPNSVSPWRERNCQELVRNINDLGDLKLPPDQQPQGGPLDRFINEESRILVDVKDSAYLPSMMHSRPPFSMPSYSYAHSGYQASHYDDVSSVNSEFWPHRSPDTSPGFTPELIPSTRHSHSSSFDGCLSPCSPLGLYPNMGQRKTSVRSTGSNTESETHSVHRDGGHVNPKEIQLTQDEEGEGEEDEEEDEGSDPHEYSGPIPNIHVHQDGSGGWPYPDHATRPTTYPNNIGGIDYSLLPPAPMEVQSTLQSAGPGKIKIDTSVHHRHRRNKSGSGASVMSPKPADVPRAKNTYSNNGCAKSGKGRSGGRKSRQRRCPEHSNLVFKHDSDYRKHMQNKHTRPFICTFYFANCQQTFGSKNEWKRHVYSQHLQLHYWHCDDHLCRDRNAVFNRKDLFGQHLKRMHSPAQSSQTTSASAKKRTMESQEMQAFISHEIPRIQERCKKERRKPPLFSRCGFCGQEFKGENSWEVRMEHVGKHYEQSSGIGGRSCEDADMVTPVDITSWKVDEALVTWALQEGIVTLSGGRYHLVPVSKEVPNVKGYEMKVEYEDEDAEGEVDC